MLQSKRCSVKMNHVVHSDFTKCKQMVQIITFPEQHASLQYLINNIRPRRNTWSFLWWTDAVPPLQLCSCLTSYLLGNRAWKCIHAHRGRLNASRHCWPTPESRWWVREWNPAYTLYANVNYISAKALRVCTLIGEGVLMLLRPHDLCPFCSRKKENRHTCSTALSPWAKVTPGFITRFISNKIPNTPWQDRRNTYRPATSLKKK